MVEATAFVIEKGQDGNPDSDTCSPCDLGLVS